MATPSEKLAESLDILREIQEKEIVAIKSDMISRTHRERLLENGFIKEVYKGWYISIPPDERKGDTTSWYSSFWKFCAQLLEDKYKKDWCLSAEHSLILHAGNWSIPQQLIIKSSEGSNSKTELPFGISLFHIKSKMPGKSETIEKDGIRLLSLPAALVQASENTFTQSPIDARTALSLINEPSQLLALLLEGGNSIVAGRLVGAFRNIGKEDIANEIRSTMEKADYVINESDPFKTKLVVPFSSREKSPYVNRLKLMWYQMREIIIQIFPKQPGIPSDKKEYLKQVEDIYITDAYHSLSIEKYKVTPDLIDKVRKGTWDAQNNEEDKKQKNAMAAKGYWEAFKLVEQSIDKILNGTNAGEIAEQDHRLWYRELFGPSITAGILRPADLAGYRNHPVYIGQSKHVPLNVEAVRDAMPAFFELLQEEKEASVRAVLGHFIFVFIHPYMDGNGRMGRFMMNTMLASGGYPWTVIPVEQRDDYMEALEHASVGQNIEPLTRFIAYLVTEGLKGNPIAKISS